MDFKPTLNLPDPDFTIPMKADLSQREPGIQTRWDEIGIYGLLLERRKDASSFVLHDGPPYTNGPIHMGTGFNKILKDFVLKSRLLMGHRVPYVPGYDNHGLPIEQAVMKKFSDQKITPTTVQLRKACREHAKVYVDLQTEQFRRLGIFGLWDKPYTTMDFRFEAEIIRVFKRLVELGYVYRGLRPTLWSPTAQTALADTEIVYQDVTSKAITVRFALRDAKGVPLLSRLQNVYALIWTTTPWTIPANLALAFHPDNDYDVVKVGDDHYILVHQLVDSVAQRVGWSHYETVGSFKGVEAEGLTFRHPIFDRDSVGVLADYVTTEDGTGVVHTAPGHGRDDFYTGLKYGLPVLCPVDERGYLTAEAGEFVGVYYKKCDSIVVDRLAELGHLVFSEDYPHSYPHAERDNQPVIFRATEQWFIHIDHNNLRERMLEMIDQKVQWHPKSAEGRFRSMISGRPDWCISRQRPWGVGIPVFYGADSRVPNLDPVAIEAVARLVEQEGSDAWYEREPGDILPKGYAHPQTGETSFVKETDVFDVWFDSGSTSLCVLEGNVEPEWKEHWPADTYLEGSDQHRGWFNVSMILGMAIHGDAPYGAVVTHGFVNDEKGQKMSKRLGNVVDPVEVCSKYGADILRYWAASVDYEDDVPCGDHLLQVAGEGYRRIRNSLRFLLGNLYDFDPNDKVEVAGIDQWIVEKADCLAEVCLEHYRDYRFKEALTAVHNFCVNEVSAFYLDAIKDRMYCDGADWPSRRSAQRACWSVLRTLTLLICPILPHTAEEVYSRMPGTKEATVLLESLGPVECVMDSHLHRQVEKMLEVRSWVFSEFETWKSSSQVRDSQDVVCQLAVSQDEAPALLSFGGDLALLFKMAGVEVTVGSRSVEFRAATWDKCERSRLRRPDVAKTRFSGEEVFLTDRDRRALSL